MQISRVILQTSMLKEVVTFYQAGMGLPTYSKDNNEVNIRIGSTELAFKQVSAADPFYHIAINIPTNKIDEAKNWLMDRVDLIWIDDYNSDIADFVNWHAKSVYFFDPAGNIVELIARFDLANKTEEPFSAAQFLSISEVGLVIKANKFDESVTRLLKQYQLSYFVKQQPLPQFRAIGDDEGLFIVVPENRNWFPTDKASGIFPMEIQFVNNGEKYTLTV